MTLPWPGLRPRLAVAVGRDRVTAVEYVPGWSAPRIRRVASRPVEPLEEHGAAWPHLARAFEELAETMEAQATVSIDVALLRPLCWAKVLRLPRMARGDVLPLLEQNVSRYFPVRGPAVVGARDAGRRGGDGEEQGRRVVACCASRQVTDAVCGAVEQAGLETGRVAAGPWAELEARLRLGSVPDGEPAGVFLGAEETPEVAVLQGGRPHALFLVSLDAQGRDTGVRTLVHGEEWEAPAPESIDEVPLAIDGGNGTSRGWKPARSSTGERLVPLDPTAVAALGVGLLPPEGPFLESPEARRERRKRQRWHILALAGAAVLLLCAAGLVHALGLQRELQAVADARAAIRPAVERTLQRRQDARFLGRLADDFARVERSRLLWSEVLAALAHHLPESSHLTSVVHDGSRTVLSVAGSDSAGTIAPALERAAAVRRVTGAGDPEAGTGPRVLSLEWALGANSEASHSTREPSSETGPEP